MRGINLRLSLLVSCWSAKLVNCLQSRCNNYTGLKEVSGLTKFSHFFLFWSSAALVFLHAKGTCGRNTETQWTDLRCKWARLTSNDCWIHLKWDVREGIVGAGRFSWVLHWKAENAMDKRREFDDSQFLNLQSPGGNLELGHLQKEQHFHSILPMYHFTLILIYFLSA